MFQFEKCFNSPKYTVDFWWCFVAFCMPVMFVLWILITGFQSVLHSIGDEAYQRRRSNLKRRRKTLSGCQHVSQAFKEVEQQKEKYVSFYFCFSGHHWNMFYNYFVQLRVIMLWYYIDIYWKWMREPIADGLKLYTKICSCTSSTLHLIWSKECLVFDIP